MGFYPGKRTADGVSAPVGDQGQPDTAPHEVGGERLRGKNVPARTTGR